MAQYDIVLVQNTAPSGIEYSEKVINLVKGSLLSSDSSGVPTVLGAGTNGYQLVADSAEATGLKWQVISAGHAQNTDTGTTNSSFTVDSDSVLGKIIIAAAAGASNNSLTLTNEAITTSDKTITFPNATGTVALTNNKLSVFAATTSAELAGIISDETGTDKLVFNTSPTFVTSLLTSSSSFDLFNTTATTLNAFGAATTLTIGYTGTEANTTNISTGATATATTKTINIGTGGNTGSTTNINLGSANGGTVTVNKDLAVSGNLTVNGTTTTVNAETINLADNIITLNSNYSGSSPTENGGIEVERGTITNASLIFDESSDVWKAGLAGSEVEISLLGHDHWVAAPATNVSTGTTGQMAYDGNFFYICTGTNVWKRTALATNW